MKKTDYNKVNIAIDFGMTNTLVATFDDSPKIMKLQGISNNLCGVDVIPSMIGYTLEKGDLRTFIGMEAAQLPEANIIRRMKRLASTSRYKKVLGKDISYKQATQDFLGHLIGALRYRFLQRDIGNVVFTVPVESFDTYRAIIDEVCEKALISKYHVLDESTAAALGYEIALSMEKAYMIIDFGGGTIDVSIIKLTRKGSEFCAKVLGKAGTNFGGTDIDDWLLEDFVIAQGLKSQLSTYSINEELIRKIERLKIDICKAGTAEITYSDHDGDFDLKGLYNTDSFRKILTSNRFDSLLQNTIDNALDNAYENGIKKRDVFQVLLVGGSSQIPAFEELVNTNFPGKIKQNDPFGAVVRGATNYLNDMFVEDYLQHQYAIEYLNIETGFYDYEIVVKEGTSYPSASVRKIVSTPFSGQKKVALKFFEIASQLLEDASLTGVHFDGSDRLVVDRDRQNKIIRKVALNPNNPSFIDLDPPSIKNQDRLDIEFFVDCERMLRIRVIDLLNGMILVDNIIVARLI